jgi:catalase (peroxidase I)
MMLTTDVALLNDAAYRALVEEFAEDLGAFEESFGAAWYKLTARDMGPHTRCIGDNVPPPQPWQYPLPPPPPPAELPDFAAVRANVARAISIANPAFPPDQYDGVDYYGVSDGLSVPVLYWNP